MKLIYLISLIFILSVSCARIQVRPEQIRDIKEAAEKVLPPNAKVEVSTTQNNFFSKPDIIISAHLLEGHSADDNNPYVKGDYGTHEKLTRLVRHRCARVIKSVLNETQTSIFNKIIIQGCNGVRQYNSGVQYGGTDMAMQIYVVSITISNINNVKLLNISEEDIMKMWTVEKNIIPELEIKSTYF